MGRTILGLLDEDGFPYIKLHLINPVNQNNVRVKAIIDTGAHPCLIQPGLVNTLQLNPTGMRRYHNPQGGLVNSQEYTLDILLTCENEKGIQIPDAKVGTIVSENYPAGMILGVRLIEQFEFYYDGPNKKFKIVIKEDKLL